MPRPTSAARLSPRMSRGGDAVPSTNARSTPFQRSRSSDEAERLATQDVLWEQVCTLPPKQRAALVLRYYEDLSEAETAELLECSVGTIKSQVSAALSKLRERVGTDSGVLIPNRSGGDAMSTTLRDALARQADNAGQPTVGVERADRFRRGSAASASGDHHPGKRRYRHGRHRARPRGRTELPLGTKPGTTEGSEQTSERSTSPHRPRDRLQRGRPVFAQQRGHPRRCPSRRHR